jgi:3-oxoacyl-[acyl-carrier-protein] synthase-3
VSSAKFKTSLFLPAQAAAETEATIVKWHIKAGDVFTKGTVLAEAESAKSTFEFEAPCAGQVTAILVSEGQVTPFDKPVIEIETDDATVKRPTPGRAARDDGPGQATLAVAPKSRSVSIPISILGVGGYLPEQVISTRDLMAEFPDFTEEYMFGVTGIRERHWAAVGEKPSDMALAAAREAIKKSGMTPEDIHGIILSTTSPDVVMPPTSCIVAKGLGIRGIPCFDLNAACSGWLYAILAAKGLIYTGVGKNILVIAADMQSRTLDKKDRNTYFLFGDGAGATVVSHTDTGHVIKEGVLTADPEGLHMARREFPGYEVPANSQGFDPWLRLDGKALFRFATASFASLIKRVVELSEWKSEDVRWVVPHQANGRIIKAAADRCGISFERFFLNIDHVGNTSSASIPLALVELERFLHKGDKIVMCTVGAGITAAAVSLEW